MVWSWIVFFISVTWCITNISIWKNNSIIDDLVPRALEREGIKRRLEGRGLNRDVTPANALLESQRRESNAVGLQSRCWKGFKVYSLAKHNNNNNSHINNNTTTSITTVDSNINNIINIINNILNYYINNINNNNNRGDIYLAFGLRRHIGACVFSWACMYV